MKNFALFLNTLGYICIFLFITCLFCTSMVANGTHLATYGAYYLVAGLTLLIGGFAVGLPSSLKN